MTYQKLKQFHIEIKELKYVYVYMYICLGKVTIMAVSIKETVPLDQGERSPDRDSYFANPVSRWPTLHTLPTYYCHSGLWTFFALDAKDRLTGYEKKPARIVQV